MIHSWTQQLDRRRFLGTLAAGSVAAAATRLARAAEGPSQAKWTLRLSASSIAFTRLPIEQAVQRIAQLGFEAIDIWSAHAGCTHLNDVQKRLGADGLRTLLDKHHLKLYAFSVYHDGYPKYAELLGKVGGGVAIHGAPGGDTKQLAARMKAYLKSLQPEIELAEKYNSYLAIENHAGTILNSPDSFKAFVEENRSPRVGIALAPYHLQAGRFSVEEVIGIVGKHLLFFYAWQHAGGVGQLPGHGPADFTPWIAALAKANYGGYVNPFLHGEPEPDATAAALGKSRDYLKQCFGKSDSGWQHRKS